MDWPTLSNYLIFVFAFLVDMFTGDSDNDTTTTNDPYALFDEADYTEILTGNGTGEAEVFETDSVAWFAMGGDDSLTGSDGNDFGAMGDGADMADMGAGNDIVYGDAGADTLLGGLGDDLLLGGVGDDQISGGAGNDAMTGDAGNDVLTGGLGSDTIYGAEGDDFLSGYDTAGGGAAGLTAADGADVLSGGAGNDTLLMGHGDTATGGEDADIFAFDARFDDGDARMTVTDFDPNSDALQLLYTPSFDSDGAEIPPNVSVSADEAGENALISFNGDVVAVINGQPDLTADAITLTPDTTSTGVGG